MSNEIYTESGELTELQTPEDFGKGLAFVNPADFPDLDNVEAGISIKPDYLEFKVEGDMVRGVFNGINEIRTQDRANPGSYKQTPAVVLQTKDGVKLNAGASLVNQLRNIAPGTAIQITYKGEEKTKSGNNVKVYEVRLLNTPRVNVVFLPTVSQSAAPALPATVIEPEQPMTYDEAWKIEINTASGKKKIGELSKEQLDYVIEHGIVNRNVEAAKIVMQHDFNMSPLDNQSAFPF